MISNNADIRWDSVKIFDRKRIREKDDELSLNEIKKICLICRENILDSNCISCLTNDQLCLHKQLLTNSSNHKCCIKNRIKTVNKSKISENLFINKFNLIRTFAQNSEIRLPNMYFNKLAGTITWLFLSLLLMNILTVTSSASPKSLAVGGGKIFFVIYFLVLRNLRNEKIHFFYLIFYLLKKITE